MNRRHALIAGLLTLLPVKARAADDDFPLMPKPNPGSSCAAPFLRTRERVDWSEQFRSDLIVWAWNNRHLVSAYVMIAPEAGPVTKIDGVEWIGQTLVPTFTLAGVEFRIVPTDETTLPPDVLWGIMGDCGQLL